MYFSSKLIFNKLNGITLVFDIFHHLGLSQCLVCWSMGSVTNK